MSNASIYGNVTVPYSVAWSGEHSFSVGTCEYVPDRRSMMQPHNPGVGKPEFGHPHLVRQREVISKCLCDVCKRPLGKRTKVSMGRARFVKVNGTPYLVPSVVEPFTCKQCAWISVQQCPHLKKAVVDGSLKIRQVTQFTILSQILSVEAVHHFAGLREGGVIGHLKLQLDQVKERDIAWLKAGAA